MVVNDKRLPFVIQLDVGLSNLNPQEGENQRFCYRITGKGQDNDEYADLSHWVLGLCPDITRDQIVNIEVTIGGIPQPIGDNVELFVPPDVDPPTGCSGLKFNYEINKVLEAPDSVGLFCFELTTAFPVGDVNTCLFGAARTASGLQICGPACEAPPPPGCEVTVSQLANVCVPITVTPWAHAGCAKTICCGDPQIGGPTCPPNGDPYCTFTVSQLVCVEIPISFGARGCAGQVSVQCEATAAEPCTCNDTEPE